MSDSTKNVVAALIAALQSNTRVASEGIIRKRLIRVASQNPSLRPQILPVLLEGSEDRYGTLAANSLRLASERPELKERLLPIIRIAIDKKAQERRVLANHILDQIDNALERQERTLHTRTASDRTAFARKMKMVRRFSQWVRKRFKNVKTESPDTGNPVKTTTALDSYLKDHDNPLKDGVIRRLYKKFLEVMGDAKKRLMQIGHGRKQKGLSKAMIRKYKRTAEGRKRLQGIAKSMEAAAKRKNNKGKGKDKDKLKRDKKKFEKDEGKGPGKKKTKKVDKRSLVNKFKDLFRK